MGKPRQFHMLLEQQYYSNFSNGTFRHLLHPLLATPSRLMLTSYASLKVENLCVTFGTKLGQIGDTTYYDFPVPSALTPVGVEEKLRALGFGYRARYIYQTARMIVNERPAGWLGGLRTVGYKEAHEALLGLQGVGPKVADCVCLMSLDKTEAVPVDTHGTLYNPDGWGTCSHYRVVRSLLLIL